MKSKVVFTLLLALLFIGGIQGQSVVRESLKFSSKELGREISYSIYLPADYETSDRHYPVLYLLHGYTDDETMWLQAGDMKAIADRTIASQEAAPMIIVMPDAWDTWYINQHDGACNYEEMFFNELIPYMEKSYRIRAKQEYRAIAGLSMGGYGSFLYSLHHPDMFAACCPLSAAVFGDEIMSQRLTQKHNDLFTRLFGTDLKHWHKNSVLKLLSEWDAKKPLRVRYYIDCGDEDGLLDGNIEAHKMMRQKEIKHELRVRNGGHTWTYWRTALPEVLKFVSQSFRRS